MSATMKRELAVDADVIVVGCGPVGVMTALRCAQRGLSVIAIDQSTEIFPLPRAIGMDEEIQRLFQNAGLLAELRSVSSAVLGAEFVDADGTRLVGIDLPDGTVGPNGHPPMIVFDQPALEAALRKAAGEAGVHFELGVRADTYDESPEGVALTISDPSGEQRRLRGTWLVGADGARSTIRRLAGIDFVDQGFDQEWIVVDATLLDPQCALPTIAQQVCDPERVVTFVPGHDTRRRWEIRLDEGESGEELANDEHLAELLSPWAQPEQLTIDRCAVYRFHALVAEGFRAGAVFLVGDAAHQMPPFNGQGMCSGMRDAENLSWKLAAVARGVASDALLDTYDTERRPHAGEQVQHAADVGRLIDALSKGEDASTEAGYGGGRDFPHIEDGLVFGDHPAVGHPLPQPTIGGEPLDGLLGAGWALLIAPGVELSSLSGMWDRLGARAVELSHPELDALRPHGETILVRPDRYVAAVTTDLHRLGRLIEKAIVL